MVEVSLGNMGCHTWNQCLVNLRIDGIMYKLLMLLSWIDIPDMHLYYSLEPVKEHLIKYEKFQLYGLQKRHNEYIQLFSIENFIGHKVVSGIRMSCTKQCRIQKLLAK